MEYIEGYQFLPGDPRLVEHIVHELKSQGIFDQFRKECLADVDTKPAYQNLRQRVDGCVSGFLNSQKWKPEMNKNQLREKLRKTIQESGFLDSGVERIVDQVVNPKISTVFLSKVEEVVYKYHGLEKPTRDTTTKTNGLNQLEICTSLLPNDLEAISPDSVSSVKHTQNNDENSSSKEPIENLEDDAELKNEEDESPPFELLNESMIYCNENSNDSHLSGISGLTSQDSVGSPKHDLEVDAQNREELSSDSKLSTTVNSEVQEESTANNEIATVSQDVVEDNETVSKIPEDSMDKIVELKMDIDSLSCDSDAKAMVIVTESSNDAETIEEKPVLGNLMNGLTIKSENETDEKLKPSTPPKSDKSSEKKSSHDSRKKSTSSHSSRNDKHHHSSSKSSSSKHRSDKYDSKHKSYDKSKSHRDSSSKRSKDSPRKSHHSRSDKDRKERSDTDSKNSSDKYKSDKSKSHRHDSHKHSKPLKKSSDDSGSDQNKISEHSSNDNSSRDSKKDKYRKKSKSQDDHGSAKNQKTTYRRSTDRDSNDGNGTGSKKHCTSSHIEQSSSKHKESSNETMERSNDTMASDKLAEGKSKHITDLSDGSQKSPSPLIMRKPKIASNIYEARRLIKVRRKIEKQVQKEKLRQQRAEENADSNKIEKVEKMDVVENEVINKPSAWKCIDSEDSDKSETAFFGFTGDYKVFHDSDDDVDMDKSKSVDEKSPVNNKTNQTKSQAEIMEIIFGGGVSMNEESNLNNMNHTNGYQVSYCSDYDDGSDMNDSGTISDSKKSGKTPDKITNCTNNNVLKKQTSSDSEPKLDEDEDYTPNGLSENKNRTPSTKSNNTSSKTNDTEKVKTKSRSSIYSSQCYSNEDLYKPRPSFGSSRRRKISATYN